MSSGGRWGLILGLALVSASSIWSQVKVARSAEPKSVAGPVVVSTPTATATARIPLSPPLVRYARAQVGKTLYYDPTYTVLAYPGGDVPIERGVCTDVVIRALRPLGVDLQQAVHEDMRAHFAAYPTTWGLQHPDRNIDHRRVPNLQRWFERQRWSQPVTQTAADYRAGDLVTWMLPGGLPHIGIVSDRKAGSRPLIIHNVGRGAREDDVLFAWPVTGHYRRR